MKKTKLNSSALTLALASAMSMAGAIATFPAHAQDAVPDPIQYRLQERTQLRIHEPSQLLSPAARDAELARLRALRTDQASETWRLQQREQMQQRVRDQINKPSDQARVLRQGPSFGPGPFDRAGAMNQGGGFGGAGGGAGAGGRGRGR